jgi:hypothetical protein
MISTREVDLLMWENAVRSQRAAVARFERRVTQAQEELSIQRSILAADMRALDNLRNKLLNTHEGT